MSTQAPEPFNYSNSASTNLTLEQEFAVASILSIVQNASREQLLSLYAELVRYNFRQKSYYEALVKTTWGLDELNKRPTEEKRGGEDTNYQAS